MQNRYCLPPRFVFSLNDKLSCSIILFVGQFSTSISLPSLQHESFVAFGANSVCRYLGRSSHSSFDAATEDIINFEEFTLTPLILQLAVGQGKQLFTVFVCGMKR